MNFMSEHSATVVADTMAHFSSQMKENPAAVLCQVEKELETLYVRYGNDWTGRGYVGDTTQEASIAALEAVRAECLSRLG